MRYSFTDRSEPGEVSGNCRMIRPALGTTISRVEQLVGSWLKATSADGPTAWGIICKTLGLGGNVRGDVGDIFEIGLAGRYGTMFPYG